MIFHVIDSTLVAIKYYNWKYFLFLYVISDEGISAPEFSCLLVNSRKYYDHFQITTCFGWNWCVGTTGNFNMRGGWKDSVKENELSLQIMSKIQ